MAQLKLNLMVELNGWTEVKPNFQLPYIRQPKLLFNQHSYGDRNFLVTNKLAIETFFYSPTTIFLVAHNKNFNYLWWKHIELNESFPKTYYMPFSKLNCQQLKFFYHHSTIKISHMVTNAHFRHHLYSNQKFFVVGNWLLGHL